MRHKLLLLVIGLAAAAALLLGCGERALQGDPWDVGLGHHR